jgi:hypothetical protein
MRPATSASSYASVGWKLAFDEPLGDLGSWELKPRIQASHRPWLETAATYKFARARGARGWTTSHGLELDLKTKHEVRDGLAFHLTQRLGLVLPPAGVDELSYRLHLIPAFTWPASWLPNQTAAESSLEAIWSHTDSEWIETKLVPLRMKFAASEGASWSLFYLINDKRTHAGWERSHVVVLAISFHLR